MVAELVLIVRSRWPRCQILSLYPFSGGAAGASGASRRNADVCLAPLPFWALGQRGHGNA